MSEEYTAERYEVLAEKWMNGTITESEMQEYADWYTGNQDRPLDIPAAFAPERDVLKERILNGVMDGMKDRGKVVRIRRTYKWAAAAAILLIAAGGYFAVKQSSRQPALALNTQTDIKAGTNKAVLTLAGGRQVVLDSTMFNDEALQHAKVSNGLLSYAGNESGGNLSWNTLSTPRGGQHRLILPDGTALWLNAASSVTFPTKFIGKDRKIKVTGEVYLEVKEDAEHPFLVAVGDAEVQVLGTHFNIKAYTDEPEVATTLLEGSVRVKSKGAEALLEPGEQARYGADNKITTTTNINTAEVVAWKDGLFQFSGSDLPAMLRQVARWYDIDVKYEGRVPEFSFEGKLQRNLDLAQVLKVLGDMNIKYSIEGKILTILP